MSALRLTFGIDPGLSGAIVTLLDGAPGPFIDMPTRTIRDWNEVDGLRLCEFIREQRRQNPGAYVSACIEKVSARPGDGGTSAFRFGESSGKVKGILEALGIPYCRAIPAVWKRYYGLLKKAGEEKNDKDAARQLALVRFPSAAPWLTRKKDDGRADALLLALWSENVATKSDFN